MTSAGVPVQVATGIVAFSGGAGGDLTQVGSTSLAERLSEIPQLQGYVDQVVTGNYSAFSLAVADTFWFGLLTTLVALAVVAIGLKEVQLRGFGRAAEHAGGEPSRPAEVPVSAAG